MASTESYLVIGGEGFLGHAIVLELIRRYPSAPVSSLDIVQRHFPDKANHWTFHSADITSLSDLSNAIKASGATTVFHTASPLAGGNPAVYEKVNVVGTRTVVEACQSNDVTKLVYTSSAGVVYNCIDLINVDERLPFPHEDKGIDAYNITKGKAEKIVLEANGKEGLLTVSLRPAGIFGPGDRQVVPGWMDVLKSGRTNFQIGDNTNLFDWTYIDNLVYAHILAAERLGQTVPFADLDIRTPPVQLDASRRELPTSVYRPKSLMEEELKLNPSFKNTNTEESALLAARTRFDQFWPDERSPAALKVDGEAFFITNGEPFGFWDFGRALWAEYNGHRAKRITVLSPSIGVTLARIAETACWLLRLPQPSLTTWKVLYSTSHRYFNIEKARRVLGYEPIVGIEEGIKRAMAYYKENEEAITKAYRP